MGIHDEDLQRVKVESDLAGIVSQYLALTKAGNRFKGLCPFHNEKTPSFSVNAEEGFFYCFGCQKSGDAITFIREIEHLDFVGAVEWLANRLGINLRYTEASDGKAQQERKETAQLLERAADYYHQHLRAAPSAGKVRSYLRGRGFDVEAVERFRIGYAPDDWDALAKYLDVPSKKLEIAGLGRNGKRGTPIDFFRDRVMFPICDVNGVVVGFGGRMMPEGQQPKYKNTPQTKMYDKSKVLYGLHLAKKAVVSADEIVVCEGYTDVIGCFRAGVGRAVATCGTALTEEHFKLMTRFAKRIVLALDADGAGKAAADKFYEWERLHSAQVFVAEMPDGSDPGQLAEEHPERLVAAIADAKPFLRYRIDRVLERSDLDTAEGRVQAATEAGFIIAEHPIEMVRDEYLKDVAQRVVVEIEQMRRLVRARSEGRPADVNPVETQIDGGKTNIVPPVEQNLLQALVHEPDIVAGLVLPVMFSNHDALSAFNVLCSEGWRDRIDEVPEHVAALLHKATVSELDADPVELVARAIEHVIRRKWLEIRYNVTEIEQLADHQAIVRWVAQRQEEMHSDETRSAAVEAVVDWLRTQETADQSS